MPLRRVLISNYYGNQLYKIPRFCPKISEYIFFFDLGFSQRGQKKAPGIYIHLQLLHCCPAILINFPVSIFFPREKNPMLPFPVYVVSSSRADVSDGLYAMTRAILQIRELGFNPTGLHYDQFFRVRLFLLHFGHVSIRKSRKPLYIIRPCASY